MISVLIADDEYLIRSLIRHSVDWHALGLEIAGEAGNGEQALKFIMDRRPDVALVDINMPFRNGLELAQEIQRAALPTIVILLTGYKDFEYARRAVTYQVFDYLTKPIEQDKLAETLLRAKGRVLQKTSDRRYFSQMQTMQYRSGKLLQGQFLWKLAFGRLGISGGRLAEAVREHGVPLQPENISSVVVQIDQYDRLNRENIDTDLYAVLNIMEESLRDAGFANVCAVLEKDNCVPLLFNADLSEAETERRLRQACERGIGAVARYFPFTVSAGVGSTMQGYDSLRFSVQEALASLENRFYEQGSRVFFARNGAATETANSFSCINFHEFHAYLSAASVQEGRQLLLDAFDTMKSRQICQEHVRLIATGMAAVLYSAASQNRLATQRGEPRYPPLFRRITECERFEDVRGIVLDLYDTVWRDAGEPRRLSLVVQAAMEYIEANHRNTDISLNKIAAAVFAAPAYVSNLFKKEMKLSTTEYITVCRMRSAVELAVRNRESNLTAIASSVGYTDPYYFSKCFKKHYGITPSRYLSNLYT